MTSIALAGVHDHRGGSSSQDRRRAVARAAGVPPALVWQEGPVTVAAPAGPATAGAVVAFVDGEVDGRPDSAEALAQSGTDGLAALRGAFSVLLWDRATGSGALARDHLGDHGLFLYEHQGRTFFASEVRALLSLLATRPAPDQPAVAHWLATGAVPGDRTLFEGIRRLPPGSLLRLGPSLGRPERYWRPRYREPVRADVDELADALREGLGQAVRQRVRHGDVPGVMLSGGLDSSCVAGIACDKLAPGQRPRAYSAVFPEHSDIDESGLIDELTGSLGMPLIRNRVRSGSAFPSALEFLDEWQLPLLGPGHLFEQPLMDRASSDGVTVMLDGQGGDELFGAAPYLMADRMAGARLTSAAELARTFPAIGDHPTRAQVRRLLLGYGVKGAAPFWLHRAHRRARGYGAVVPPWFTAASTGHFAEIDDDWAWKRDRNGPRWWAHLESMLTDLRERFGLPDYVRQRSKAAGMRGRSPLLDVDLVELMLSVPPAVAFDAALGRPLARRSLKGLVPDRVRLRPGKADFSGFYHQSLAGENFAPIRRLLTDPSAEVYAFVDRDAVQVQLIASPPQIGVVGWRSWAPAVWRLASIEVWLRMQRDQGLPQALLERAPSRSRYEIDAAP